MELLDYFEETVQAMREQIKSDQARWGDTWKRRPIKGQEKRCFDRFKDYWDQFKNAGTPMPWLKIIGEANIAITRENHPEELIEEEELFYSKD